MMYMVGLMPCLIYLAFLDTSFYPSLWLSVSYQYWNPKLCPSAVCAYYYSTAAYCLTYVHR